MTASLLLDPTAEFEPATRPLSPRPVSLAGRTVGLLDIAKSRGDLFLDRIEEHLRARGLTVLRWQKPTFTKPAPPALLAEIAGRADVVIEALAD